MKGATDVYSHPCHPSLFHPDLVWCQDRETHSTRTQHGATSEKLHCVQEYDFGKKDCGKDWPIHRTNENEEVRIGNAVTPNYELPMYREAAVLTAHGRRFRGHTKRPDLQFLAIPYDVRHKVYLSLLASVVSVDCMPTWVLKPNRQFLTLTSLFRACRQTRNEFAPLFYRNILFSIYLESPFHRLYRELRLPAIHGLRKIHLTIDAGSLTNTHYETLRVAANLRELYLTFKHMDTYFSCLAGLNFLLGVSHLDARHDLCLFQVMVDSQTFYPITNGGFFHEALFAANGHWHATDDWGTPTIVSTHFKRDSRRRSRVCTRVDQKGYESSLDQRCEGLAVGNPMWEIPKVPMERLSPQNIWIQ